MRWWRIRQRDEEIERELTSDLYLEEQEQRERGLAAEEARYAARRAFGNPTVIREQTREIWAFHRFASLARDLRYGLRTLRRAKGFTMIAVLIMGLGIGSNIALFTVVRGVLLKPLPFPDPDRLVSLYQSQKEFGQFVPIDAGSFALWQQATRNSVAMAIVNSWQQYNVSVEEGRFSERVEAAWCSANFFSVLGVTPALGRSFTTADDRPGSEATVILSNGFWKRRFGGDPHVVGSRIWLNAAPYTVIGVLPSWFKYEGAFVGARTQLWTTVGHEAPPDLLRSFNVHAFVVVGRLLPGSSLSGLLAQLNAVQKQIKREHPGAVVRETVKGRSLLEDEVWAFKTPLYALLAATACLLLIACVNVASLLVARSAALRKEMAVRVALGAGPSRLVRERLIEGFLLSIGGGLLGVLLAIAALQWLIHVRQDMNRLDSIHMDGWVVVYTLGAMTLCALVVGLTSAYSIDGKRMMGALQENSRGNSGHARLALRRVLITIEVGLTVILLIGAGLLIKSYQQMRSADLGIPTTNVLTMQFSLSGSRNSGPQFPDFFERILDRVRSLPGVQSAGLVNSAPGQGWGGDRVITVPEHGPVVPGQGVDLLARGADPGYFSAVGIPLLRGRTFTRDERLDRANTTLLSADAATLLFPGEDPIGKQLKDSISGETWQIVGIVGETRFSVREPARPTMYISIFNGSYSSATLVLHGANNVEDLATPVEKVIAGIKPDLPVFAVSTMDETLSKSTLDESFDATLLVAFAALSLALAAVGLFGVLSYMVAQQTGEIGIRIALGAQREQVLRKVLLDGIRPPLVGLTAGLAASAAVGTLIRSILYETRPLDPGVYAGVAALLLAVAVAASVAPAWRAARLDPMQALRTE